MKIVLAVFPCAIATLMAVHVSIVLIEDVVGKIACILVGLLSLGVAGFSVIRTPASRLRSLVLALVPGMLFIALVWTHAPLHFAFRLWHADFEDVASQIEAGASPSVPFRIGPFTIRMVGRRGSSEPVYLATNTELHEINGFVKDPKGEGFNLWSCISLDDKWSYIAED
jgi:hypothetical protein